MLAALRKIHVYNFDTLFGNLRVFLIRSTNFLAFENNIIHELRKIFILSRAAAAAEKKTVVALKKAKLILIVNVWSTSQEESRRQLLISSFHVSPHSLKLAK